MMTRENKELLLKDLCARLPYKTLCNAKIEKNGVNEFGTFFLTVGMLNYIWLDCHELRPYLRPLSSMTEEEKTELCVRAYAPDKMETLDEKLNVVKANAENASDFYNAHHLDFRGLIPMGLALEATDGMYKTE